MEKIKLKLYMDYKANYNARINPYCLFIIKRGEQLMDFMLTEQQQMMKKLFAEFAEKDVKPLAHEIDEEERFPYENVEKMKACKMLGIPYAREYGGGRADYLCYILAVEELSKKCGTTGVVLSAHTS
jgi:butyryl-CoA dehydrogenase